MRADTVGVFAEATRSLRDAGVAHALVGASALGAYTLGRATLDMDFLVAPTPEPLDRTLRGLHLVERTKDVFFDQTAYIFEVATYVTPIECFVATHWLTSQALARARPASIAGLGEVPIIPPDDTAAIKASVAGHPARFAAKRATDVADLARLRDAEVGAQSEHLVALSRRLAPGAVEALREAGYAV